MSDKKKDWTQEELFETLKNGPLRQGEILMIANGKSIRIAIQSFQINDSFDFAAPTFTLDGVCFSDHKDLYTVLYGRGR